MSHTLERVLARLPYAPPDADALGRARIVSHRGERDDRRVLENTFEAFDPAIAAGVAAIEFDVRYTRDHEPVVIHDADLRRVFGHNEIVAQTSWADLHRRAPRLPHLAALIERYAPHAHLMLELKTRGSDRAENRLAELLSPLEPRRDFHLLSLDPSLFAGATGLPADCFLPVAKFNLARLFDWAQANECAGLAGPFALLRTHHIRTLRHQQSLVGSGFVSTPAMCLREIGRGVDWIFSNHAVHLQRGLAAARARRAAAGALR